MKFATKLISAAVALGLSGHALASGNPGDIYVDIYDPKTTESFVLDTGVALQQTASTGLLAQLNLSSYADWGTFSSAVTAAGGSLSNLLFTALAGTGTSRSGFFNQSFSTTSSGVSFSAMLGNANLLNGFVAGPLGDSIQAAGAWAALVGPFGDFGGLLGTGGIGTSTVGTSMGIYGGNQSGLIGALPVTTISLSTTQLTIGTATSPTPEPGTYGLMVAGLLAVGAIVRRRSRA